MVYRITYRNNRRLLRIVDVADVDDVITICAEIADSHSQLISVVLREGRRDM